MQELFGRWLNSFAYFRLLAERLIEFEEGRVRALTTLVGKVGGVGSTWRTCSKCVAARSRGWWCTSTAIAPSPSSASAIRTIRPTQRASSPLD